MLGGELDFDLFLLLGDPVFVVGGFGVEGFGVGFFEFVDLFDVGLFDVQEGDGVLGGVGGVEEFEVVGTVERGLHQ